MKYFSDRNGETVELTGSYVNMPNAIFREMFPGVRGIKYDGFSMAVMVSAEKGKGVDWTNSPWGMIRDTLPVSRKINYKHRPSLHECNARCMGGKCGGTCECRCGGKNHGINN